MEIENFEVEKTPKQKLKEQEDKEIDLKSKESESFEKISEDNIVDPETENFEDLILEDVDARRPVVEEINFEGEYDPSTEEFKKKGGFVSKNKNYIPHAIWKIKMKYSLPGSEWKKLSPEEKVKIKRKAQREIEELYIKESIPFEKNKAA